MRIALCLTGLLGGLKGRNGIGKTIDPLNGFYWFNKNIFQNNDVDVFFHTWSDSKFDLVSIYEPKKYLIENQENFSGIDSQFYGFESYESLYVNENRLDQSYVCSQEEIIDFKNLIFRANSKWASFTKAIKLKSEYEEENNFKYDFVVTTRFDVALVKRIDFSSLKKHTLYLSKRNEKQAGEDRAFNDLIFIGDSNVLNLFSKLFDERYKYSIDPIYSCYDHIVYKEIKWQNYFEFDKDIRILRWNQHLMRFNPQPYYFIRHSLREIKRKFLNV